MLDVEAAVLLNVLNAVHKVLTQLRLVPRVEYNRVVSPRFKNSDTNQCAHLQTLRYTLYILLSVLVLQSTRTLWLMIILECACMLGIGE